MADQKRWFKVWTSIIANGRFAEMSLEDIGRWTLLGAATALDGDKGELQIPGQGKELCRILRVPDLDAAKDVLARIFSVTFEEGKNRDGEHSVTWRNWHKYQEDSSAAERMKALRSKRRGEERRREERRKDLKKPDGPVDKSKPETETPDPWAPVWQRAGVLVKDGWPHAAGFVGRAKKDGYGPADVLQAFDSVQRKRKEQPDVEVWSYAWGSLKRIYPERNQREGERYKKDDPVHIKQILTAVGKK